MRKHPRFPRPRRYKASTKPSGTADAALYVRKFVLGLFDREDGKAADWPLIAETLFMEAFYAIDQSPAGDPGVIALLRRALDDSYYRLTAGPAPSPGSAMTFAATLSPSTGPTSEQRPDPA